MVWFGRIEMPALSWGIGALMCNNVPSTLTASEFPVLLLRFWRPTQTLRSRFLDEHLQWPGIGHTEFSTCLSSQRVDVCTAANLATLQRMLSL